MNGAYLYAVLGAAGFSFKAIFIKLAYRHGVDTETLLALRMGLALPFFLVMGVVAERRASHAMHGGDWAWMLGLGFFGYYLASYLDFLGLQFISAALERLILFLNPSIVVLLSALFLGKPVTRRALVALALSYAGLGLVMVHDFQAAPVGRQVVLGSLLVFGSAVSYALYLMGNGQVVGRLGSGRVTAWATTVACLLCIGQFLLMRPATAVLQQPLPVYGWAAAMALVSTVAPVWLMSEAIRRLGAGPVAITATLGPVLTLMLGWLMLDEQIGPVQIAGAALVVGGVFFMSRRPSAPPAAAAAGRAAR